MRKSALTRYRYGGPRYVIAHAEWQRSRGRQPSEPFEGFRNPDVALRLAVAMRSGDVRRLVPVEPGVYKVRAAIGADIADVASSAVAVARILKSNIEFDFNGKVFVATPRSSWQDVYDDWDRDQRRSSEQNAIDRLLSRLDDLDLSNVDKVVGFIAELQPLSDYVGVVYDHVHVMGMLEAAGYRANANAGAAYDPDDRDNAARYVIGQAIAFLKLGDAIHQMVGYLADDWLEKHGSVASAAAQTDELPGID